MRRPPVRIALAIILTAAIFIFDTVSPLGIAVAVLYVIVIMMSVDYCDRRGIVLISLGCATLTVLAYLIGHRNDFSDAPLLRCLVSLSAIGITAVLAWRSRRATETLSQSEKRYRNIFQAAGVSIWEEDFSQVKTALDNLAQRGVTNIRDYLAENPQFVQNCISMVRIVDLNDAAVRLIGARDKTEVTSSLKNIFLPETAASFSALLCAMFDGQRSCEYETAIRTLSGERRSILMAATFPPDPDMYGSVLVSVLDITERNRTQRALQQAQAALAHVSRVSTLGELTASIAHEVNQPLAAIVTNGEACLRWLDRKTPELSEARACVARAIGEGRRAGEVVQRLRALSTRSELQLVSIDVNTVIQEVVLLIHREALDHGVTIELDLAFSLSRVKADKVQLQQVLLNLAVNGMHAMEAISDRPRRLAILSRPDAAGGVQISIRDHGTGIATDAMTRLFDAFFTTRPDGMGMGLSICRSIVESYGGRIWVENNSDFGATLHFTLPPSSET